MKRWVLWVPLLLFAGIAITAAVMLNLADRTPQEKLEEKRSMLVGKELPRFSLPAALPNRASIDRADFSGRGPRLLNVFASWCIPCIEEAPQLMALSQRGLPIDAVAIRDRPEDIARFLGRWGDPYAKLGLDRDSSLQLALGSRGVPETFIVDGAGVIRYHHVGPVSANDLARILDEYERARR